MDLFDNAYYHLTQHLMEAIGLWPYQKPTSRTVRLFCVLFIFFQSILAQFATFITNEYNAALFIEVLSFNILCFIYVLKYNVVYFNSDHVKKLFDEIQRHWNLVEDANELKIIEKYAYKVKFYTLFSACIVYPGTLAFILVAFIPDVLDIIKPLDEPRLKKLPIKLEFFVDTERYFYYFVFLIMAVAMLGMTILVATENMIMILIQHACGLYELASHRLTFAINKSSSGTTPYEDNCKVYMKLRSAFILHQECLEFIDSIQCKFRASYLVLCIFGVASLSVNMFRMDHGMVYRIAAYAKIVVHCIATEYKEQYDYFSQRICCITGRFRHGNIKSLKNHKEIQITNAGICIWKCEMSVFSLSACHCLIVWSYIQFINEIQRHYWSALMQLPGSKKNVIHY